MPYDFSTEGNKNRKNWRSDGDGFVASLSCIDECVDTMFQST